jgi:hypothetical protein
MVQAASQTLLLLWSSLSELADQPSSCFQPKAELAWSLVSSSATLSGFSAVLAAFMFAAMILLLTRELKEYSHGKFQSAIDSQIGRPIAFMFSAFFSLVMAAFLFAAITGEEADKANPRQFIEGALPSLVLALGVVQMAVGLAWLLRVRDLFGVPAQLARLVVHATVILAGFFLTGVVISPVLQRLVDPAFALSPFIVWLILMGVIVAAIPLGVLCRRPLGRYVRQDQVVLFVNVGSIAMSVAAALGWTLVSSVSRCAVLPLYNTGAGNLIVLASFGLVMLMLAALEVATPGRERPLRGLR